MKPIYYKNLQLQKGTDFVIELDLSLIDIQGSPNLINSEFTASLKESYFSDTSAYFTISNSKIDEDILILEMGRDVTSNLSIYNHVFNLYLEHEDFLQKIAHGIAKVYP